jgi:hypothetical protein
MAKDRWANRIIGEDVVEADQLLAHPFNWRVHSTAQQRALESALDGIGWIQRVIVNQRTGYVLDGHLRVAMAISRGEQVPVQYVDLDEDEERLALATIDPLSAMAAADRDMLADLLGDLRETELVQDDAALRELLNQVAGENAIAFGDDPTPDPGAQMDRAEELREVWQTERGQVWDAPSASVPGRSHRVMCGDSTSADDVARLMGGEKAQAVVTDPPYGINAAQMTMGSGKNKLFSKGEWDLSRPDLLKAIDINKVCIIWGGNYFADALPISGDWLCWHKKNDGLSFAEFELAWTNIGCNARLIQHHWGAETKEHITQKPTEVIRWCLSFLQGDIYDPFLGSGTTAVAAEQTGRICYGMELEPKYVAVTLQRLADMGLEPRLVDAN